MNHHAPWWLNEANFFESYGEGKLHTCLRQIGGSAPIIIIAQEKAKQRTDNANDNAT